jgi:hypothetical protein
MHPTRLPLAVAALLIAGSAPAQDDKFAGCPDPDAARKYVKDCLASNPYNSRETCEELALEKLCQLKK